MKLKIFIISNLYPSQKNISYGTFIKNLNDGLVRSGIEISSTSLIRGRGKYFIEKITKYFKFYLSIIYNTLRHNYDIIYIHYPIYTIIPFLLLLPIIKKPIVLNFHGNDVFTYTKFAYLLQRLSIPLINKAHTIVVPSNYFKKIVMSKFTVSEDKIFVSPSSGVDMKMFNYMPKLKNNNRFTLGFVGRIEGGKGWEVLLHSLNDLKTRIPNIYCLIAGEGKLVPEMKKMIMQNNLGNIVNYVGPIHQHDLNQFYNKLDLFIFPTYLNESLGLVGIEALACGTPIVCSKIGGLIEYVINGENGYYFEPNNYKQLADKIYYLFKNNNVLLSLKTNTRKSVERYDQDLVIKNIILKLYEISK